MYLLNCHLYLSKDPFIQAFMVYSESILVNKIEGAELERLQALIERLKPVKDYEGGPGVSIK